MCPSKGCEIQSVPPGRSRKAYIQQALEEGLADI